MWEAKGGSSCLDDHRGQNPSFDPAEKIIESRLMLKPYPKINHQYIYGLAK
jgi:hypothetical protein